MSAVNQKKATVATLSIKCNSEITACLWKSNRKKTFVAFNHININQVISGVSLDPSWLPGGFIYDAAHGGRRKRWAVWCSVWTDGQTQLKSCQVRPRRVGRDDETLRDKGAVMATRWHCTISLTTFHKQPAPTSQAPPTGFLRASQPAQRTESQFGKQNFL